MAFPAPVLNSSLSPWVLGSPPAGCWGWSFIKGKQQQKPAARASKAKETHSALGSNSSPLQEQAAWTYSSQSAPLPHPPLARQLKEEIPALIIGGV